MPAMIRLGGKMYGADGRTKDTKAVNPESTFSRIYQEIINFCKTNGQFDPTTMGTVPNVGLMAQQAEEYGSHDKTFEIPEDGVAEHRRHRHRRGAAVAERGGGRHLAHARRQGRRDPRLGEAGRHPRARVRHAGGVLAGPVPSARERADQEGQDVPEGPRHRRPATSRSCRRCGPCGTRWSASIRGQDTIAATGNILRDYLTDLFPILELGTSAKMLSIVPLMAGGGMYETGAGGSAPKHVQQLVEENHLRWDSLGEFLALGACLEDLGNKTGNKRAALLGKTLDAAIGKLLENDKGPSRKTGELDNRGSQFYLALYWAQELAAQTEDQELADHFAELAKALSEKEDADRVRTRRGARRFGGHRRLLLPGPREDHSGDAAE